MIDDSNCNCNFNIYLYIIKNISPKSINSMQYLNDESILVSNQIKWIEMELDDELKM